jgi:hypothetical protein
VDRKVRHRRSRWHWRSCMVTIPSLRKASLAATL